jgi:hypothetical protein
MDPIAILMSLLARGGLRLAAWRALLALALLVPLAPVQAQVALPSQQAKSPAISPPGSLTLARQRFPGLRDVNGVRQVQAIVVSSSAIRR